MTNRFQNAAILGAGLLGGSLGMALRRTGVAGRVAVWSPSAATREACASASWCGGTHARPAEACAEADLVVLCGPVDRIPPLLDEISPACRTGCLVTDVGSTKEAICRAGAAAFPPGHPADFVGSHPMAGSEKSGLAFAREDLFAGRVCIITPVKETSAEATDRAVSLWTDLGMKVVRSDPGEHDRIVARISHLPHLAAAALSSLLAGGAPEEKSCAGPGLRDTTRVAAGDPRLWTAIFRQNETAVREALDALQAELDAFRAGLDQPGDEAVRRFLEKACRFRRSLDEGDAPS